jgi:hypothetical protein
VFAVQHMDIVPLGVNGVVGDSYEDDELPVFDLKVFVFPFIASGNSCFEIF